MAVYFEEIFVSDFGTLQCGWFVDEIIVLTRPELSIKWNSNDLMKKISMWENIMEKCALVKQLFKHSFYRILRLEKNDNLRRPATRRFYSLEGRRRYNCKLLVKNFYSIWFVKYWKLFYEMTYRCDFSPKCYKIQTST